MLDRARALAAGLGVSPGLAEALLSLLIRSSLANQEQARVRAEGQGSGKPALVIGGSGKMGRWFTEFLHSQGFNVTVADPAGPVPGFRHVADWRETAGRVRGDGGVGADPAHRRHPARPRCPAPIRA